MINEMKDRIREIIEFLNKDEGHAIIVSSKGNKAVYSGRYNISKKGVFTFVSYETREEFDEDASIRYFLRAVRDILRNKATMQKYKGKIAIRNGASEMIEKVERIYDEK